MVVIDELGSDMTLFRPFSVGQVHNAAGLVTVVGGSKVGKQALHIITRPNLEQSTITSNKGGVIEEDEELV